MMFWIFQKEMLILAAMIDMVFNAPDNIMDVGIVDYKIGIWWRA